MDFFRQIWMIQLGFLFLLCVGTQEIFAKNRWIGDDIYSKSMWKRIYM